MKGSTVIHASRYAWYGPRRLIQWVRWRFKHLVCYICMYVYVDIFDSSPLGQNGLHFADDIFKCIFVNENVWIPVKNSLKFVLKGLINNIPVLVQILMVTRPEWVNMLCAYVSTWVLILSHLLWQLDHWRLEGIWACNFVTITKLEALALVCYIRCIQLPLLCVNWCHYSSTAFLYANEILNKSRNVEKKTAWLTLEHTQIFVSLTA